MTLWRQFTALESIEHLAPPTSSCCQLGCSCTTRIGQSEPARFVGPRGHEAVDAVDGRGECRNLRVGQDGHREQAEHDVRESALGLKPADD